MTYTIEIPNWHPTRLNTLMSVHWGEANRLKSADAQMMATYAHKAKVPKAIGKRLVEIIIQIHKGPAADADAYYKSVHDGLVITGYLKDDSTKWVDFKPAQFVRGKSKATTIKITDIV